MRAAWERRPSEASFLRGSPAMPRIDSTTAIRGRTMPHARTLPCMLRAAAANERNAPQNIRYPLVNNGQNQIAGFYQTAPAGASGKEPRLVAAARSDLVVQSVAAALAVSPAEVQAVRVSPLGVVTVEGTLGAENERRLASALQSNREFVELYRRSHGIGLEGDAGIGIIRGGSLWYA